MSFHSKEIVNENGSGTKESSTGTAPETGQALKHFWANGMFLNSEGELTFDPLAGYYVNRGDIERVFQNITRNSVYALEEELRNGM